MNMDFLGLTPYGIGYTRLYNSLLGILVLTLALSLFFFVAALSSPHDVQVVEVNKSIASWNEQDDRELLKPNKFRADIADEELWLHWTDTESGNYSVEISQMNDLASYNASYFKFDDDSSSLNLPQEFSEATVPVMKSPVFEVVFKIIQNDTDTVLKTSNVTLWQVTVIAIQCEDHCSTICGQQGGIWRDQCYVYATLDTVCIAVQRDGKDWEYVSGCYGLDVSARYRLVTPGLIETFSTVKFEVRSEKDPFLKAVEVTTEYAEFAASSV